MGVQIETRMIVIECDGGGTVEVTKTNVRITHVETSVALNLPPDVITEIVDALNKLNQ